MALIDDVKDILEKLAPHGWNELFKAHGLDISAQDLEKEILEKPLLINRNLKGFKDFAREGEFGVTPGVPAHSLIYHALASPAVLADPSGNKLRKFPTIKQIETVENYVYASVNRTYTDILNTGNGTDVFAIAVFALEYRNSEKTVHGKHADLCFSRAGVGRVGNKESFYSPEARGYRPFIDGDSENTIRTIPVRYAAYLAIQLKGNENDFGPVRFDFGTRTGQSKKKDSDTNFWVPVHKLFDGNECIQGFDLELAYNQKHTNEKLKRIHLETMGKTGFNTGHHSPEIDAFPFKFHDGIASRSTHVDNGACIMEPIPHSALVEEAKSNSQTLTVKVPSNNDSSWSPSYTLDADGKYRKAPEYVHVRDSLLSNGNINKLNDKPNVKSSVSAGNYAAIHYLDFTGDGWVRADCKQIDHLVPRSVPAYSVVAACDFFPQVDQGSLMDWWLTQVPSAIRQDIWEERLPLSLSDQRTAPNLTLEDVDFRPEDISVTAIVSQKTFAEQTERRTTSGEATIEYRNGILPDSAAGMFQPGWDTSIDIDSNQNEYITLYGLGSPFPEDAKLCAALSTFWPAAAPDSSRQYSPNFAIVCPLTDEEIGLSGGFAWDGNMGPRLINIKNTEVVEYNKFEYVDSTEHAKLNNFSLAKTAKVTFNDYVMRILAMNRVYQALKLNGNFETKRKWGLIGFNIVQSDDPDVQSTGIQMSGSIMKFDIFKSGRSSDDPNDFKKEHVTIDSRFICIYNGSREILVRKHGEVKWDLKRVK